MDAFLHQVLAGLATGGIYASLALALVMIYQATHLVNFAQGEMAMFTTYIAWSLVNAGMSYWAAFFLTIVFAFVMGVLIERIVIRPVENAPVLAVVVVFIALLVILNSVAGWIYTYTIKSFPSPFPKEAFFSTRFMSPHEMGAIGITLVVLVLLFAFFRFTPLGLAMRAAAQNPQSSRLVGIRVGWMLALGWGLAAAVGAVAGMMVAPIVYLDPALRFRQRAAGRHRQPWRRGGRRLHGRGAGERAGRLRHRQRAQAAHGARAHHRRAVGAALGVLRQGARHSRMTKKQLLPISILLVIACALPFVVSNYRTFQFTLVMVYATALLGLNILTGYNGQISLGHGAFYALGAYCAAVLMDQAGAPYWATIPAAAAVCLVAGFLFGLPALRLEGLYLALATFALGVAMPQLLKYDHFAKWTGGVQGIVIAKPEAPWGLPLNPDQWLYFFTLAVTLVMFLLAWNLLRGRIGRALVAIRDQHIAAEAMGVNNAIYKSLAFGVSAMYTGVAGALSAIAIQYVAPDSFNIFVSIVFVVGIVVGGLASISGALYGALFIQFVPNIADEISKAAPWAIFGIFMIGFVYLMPTGVAGAVRLLLARRRSI